MRHAARAAAPQGTDDVLYRVRSSGIHGKGVYATQRIRKGTRIIEYLGDRITHEEADDRYEAKGQDDGHTFLFVVNDRIVIDAGVGGNDARFINHRCEPNCDTVIENDRVFIEAVRTIEPGEELGYEYGLTWESTDDPEELKNYACRCGAPNCRGTMLDEEPLDKKKPAKRRRTAKRKAKKKALKKEAATRTTTSKARPGKSRRK
jgi:SET domain-containing protein